MPAVAKWTPLFEAPRAHGSDLLQRAPTLAAHSGSLTALSAVWEFSDVWRLLHWPPCPGTKPKGTRTTQQFSFHYLLGQLHETSLMGSGLHVLAEESESSTCSPFFTELFVESNFLATLTSTVSSTPLSSPLTKEMWLLGGVYWFHKRGKGYVDMPGYEADGSTLGPSLLSSCPDLYCFYREKNGNLNSVTIFH